MKAKIFLLSIILLLPAAGVFAQKQSAATVVQSFYAFHGSAPKTFDKAAIEARRKWFTRDLYRLFLTELEREEDFLKKNPTDKPHYGDGLPFEPWEECLVGNTSHRNIVRVQAADANGSKALVPVKFFEPQQCGGKLIATYQVRLVKSDDKWLIDDWIYEDGETLTQDLKRKDY
jgi:hypothetical protein